MYSWEDEVRKGVSKPDILLLKDPAKYDAEDLKVLEIYKQKLEDLEIKREKYKTHLINEIHKINSESIF